MPHRSHAPRIVLLHLLCALFAALPAPGASGASGASGATGSLAFAGDALAARASAIVAADFANDRAELARQAEELALAVPPELAAAASYWRGFALWRRALNGFNETPSPPDLRSDLTAAVVAFRSAVAGDPASIEPKIGLAFAIGGLGFLARADPEQFRPLAAEYVPLVAAISAGGQENPRALWLVGGSFLWAPPPRQDFEKALDSYRRGLAAARKEALSPAPSPWAPRWGAPELLMSCAFFHAQMATTPNRELARAYAEGALAVAPTWHYVRDILLPQIEALPAPKAEPAAAAPASAQP
jgi:hypothetical protein